jgi:hypothetical protein
VKTSDVHGAGTDANVYVRLRGVSGESGELHLKTSTTFKDPFERAHEDVFVVSRVLPQPGDLTQLHVRHDNKGKTDVLIVVERYMCN